MGSLDNNLYILHGWTTSTERWAPFLEELKKRGVEPVFLKIPGLSAPLDIPWNIDNYVDWLDKTLPLDKRVSILGHSNGGRIALAFALKFPERLDQIILIDSAGIYHNDFGIKLKRSILKTISKIGKKLTSSHTAKNFLYKIAQESDYKNATPLMRETMKNLISFDITPDLKRITIPVTIIWGENDLMTPYTDALVFKNELPNCTLFKIEGALHSPQFTNAAEVADIVKNEFK